MTELEKKYYMDEAKQLDIYKEYYETPEYSMDYIDFLKSLMVRHGVEADKVIESLPSPMIIKEDVKHLIDLSKRLHYHLSLCLPVSYVMTEYEILDKDIELFGERPYYYIKATEEKEYATYTTSDFIQKEYKGKRLIRKK